MTVSKALAGIAIAVVLALTAGPGSAADAQRGRLLYENHCMVCHTSVAHIRDDRRVVTPVELRGQVTRWSTHLELPWQAEERDDVTAYLNERYYRFPSAAQ
jgi:cytochrome c2